MYIMIIAGDRGPRNDFLKVLTSCSFFDAIGLGAGGGGNRGNGRKPDRGKAERGGNRRSRRETAVDESREEMADRVERHQAG